MDYIASSQLRADPMPDMGRSLSCIVLLTLVVMQIAAVAAWEAPAEEEEGSSNAELVLPCAGAAQQMLLELGTNPAHGLAPGGGNHGSFTDNIGGACTTHASSCDPAQFCRGIVIPDVLHN